MPRPTSGMDMNGQIAALLRDFGALRDIGVAVRQS
jgi:hypothetical protein